LTQIVLRGRENKLTVKLQQLVDLTNASDSSIRRDLTLLEKNKLLKRVHGGAAKLQGMLKELSMTEKSSKNLQKKQRIAKFASDLIEEGDSIYIDAGSTTYEMINNLPDNIVVVTNGMMHVNALLENNMTTYLLGG